MPPFGAPAQPPAAPASPTAPTPAPSDSDSYEPGPAESPAAPIGPGLPQLPPIGMLSDPPSEAPPAGPAGPGGLDRRVLLVGGIVAAVIVVVAGIFVFSGGSKVSSSLSPDETVGSLLPVTTARPGIDIPTENQDAVAMLPTKGDFGDAWSQIELRAGSDAFQLGPNPSTAQCVLPPPDVPEAGARVDLADYYVGGSVAAQVKVFPDVTPAAHDVNNAPVTSDVTTCVQQASQAELAKLGIADVVTVTIRLDDVASPGIGEESYAYRITETVAAGSHHLSRTIDVLSFRTGRTVGELTVSSPFGTNNAPLLSHARDVFTSRFGPL